MSNSPRSMWAGSIELGLLNIPVTIGKAWSDEREKSLVQVCNHGDAAGASKISRDEYCPQCKGSPKFKTYAVDMGECYRVFDEEEMASIEAATKTITLQIEDVQPLDTLPLVFSTGVYYLRHDDKAKVQPRAMNRLVTALGKTGYGLICHWGNSSSQKLCVISAERGILILRIIPHLSEIRAPSKKEREHWSVPEDAREAEKMIELLGAMKNPNGFQYGEYHDKGYELRTAAVERILAGEQPEPVSEPEREQEQINIFDALEQAIADQKEKVNA